MKKKIALALCFVMLLGVLFTGCSKTITVETVLTEITFTGAESGKTGEAYTATLTPSEHFELPETITVTADGAEITGYTYDAETGALTIPADAVTGNLVITAAATESLIGTWTGNVDMTALINEAMIASDETLADYFQFSNLYFTVNMTFTEDGTCSLAFDSASLEALLDDILTQMEPGMTKLLEELVDYYGYDTTVEELLESMGYSTMAAYLEDQMNPAALLEDMDTMDQEGNYLVQDGILYMSGSLDEEAVVDENNTTPYTLENGVLTIEAGSLAEEEYADMLFPLVLSRVS